MTMRSALGGALVALWLSGLHRLQGRGARRLRSHDLPGLLDRRDVLVLDTETTGVGREAEISLQGADGTATRREAGVYRRGEGAGAQVGRRTAGGRRWWMASHRDRW